MTDARDDHRFPWRVTAVVVAIVVAASVLSGLLLTQDRVGTDQPVPAASPAPSATVSTPLTLAAQRQVTLLLTIRDDQRAAVSSLLIGVGGGTGFVAELLLPRDLLLPTVPPMRLAEVDDPTGPQTAEQPLETLLGVQVDAIVDLDRLAWAGLIDITSARVDPQAAMTPGSFPLSVDSVLQGIPYAPEDAGQLLTSLGSMARTTVTNEDASSLLALIGRQLRVEDVRREVLPVTYVPSGSSRVALADLTATEPVVRSLFPEALLQPGHDGPVRVVLQRAGATLGALTQARLDLADAGYGVVVDPAVVDPVATSTVLVPSAPASAQQAGLDVAVDLGLPPSSVSTTVPDLATVDVRVLLGADATVGSP